MSELLAAGAFVNADVIARSLSAFDSERVEFQAGRIMVERLRELAAQRSDFAFETTRPAGNRDRGGRARGPLVS
jgi:predicted ABC-type ATPase